MVNKRGLSPDEYFTLDPEILDMLMVYDSYIEKSGSYIDMMYHAHALYNNTINNPNISIEARKSIKVSDFDFLGVLDNMTSKERVERNEKKKKEQSANSIMAIGEAIMNEAMRNKNGGK